LLKLLRICLGLRRIGGDAASFPGAGVGEAARRRPAGAVRSRATGHFPSTCGLRLLQEFSEAIPFSSSSPSHGQTADEQRLRQARQHLRHGRNRWQEGS
uniref:Uncharacterized protein n=1 Tax=Oryza nivara TaxID=4536 RepID=A0A0E0FH01_ORYNI